MDKWSIRVRDILSRDLFKHAAVIAGKGGLDREIKWTHILEGGDIESFTNGGELILTTGSEIEFDSPRGLVYLDKMVKKNVVGICIELGTHVNKIATEILEHANQHHLPIIVFEEIVKFVDITQDLHTLIINAHHQKLNKLYTLSDKFNEFSLMPNGILKILKEIHTYFEVPVFFVPDGTKHYYYPPESKASTKPLTSLLKKQSNKSTHSSFVIAKQDYTLIPVKGLGNICGYLLLEISQEALNEFSFSLLDRATLAIAQIMLRNQTIEERKQHQEEEIVRNMVSQQSSTMTEIQKVLPAPATNLYYRLFLIDTSKNNADTKDEDWEEIKLQQAIIIRSLFKKNGFLPALAVNKNEIVIIAAFYNQDETKRDKNRFTDIIQELQNIQQKQIFDGTLCSFGISNIQQDYQAFSTSYQEAKDVLFIQHSQVIDTNFHEDIGVYRLLLELYHNNNLQEYVQDYLGPIIQHDKKMKSELLSTLSVYLKCMGSKKETAEQLFIVRQTLYHRLEKIEELIKTDLMNPTYRQAIELALSAYELLKQHPTQDGLGSRKLIMNV